MHEPGGQHVRAVAPGRRLIACYLGIQGTLGVVWWLTMWLVPASRAPFAPAGIDDRFVFSFLIADALLFVGLSLLGCVLQARNARGARTTLLLCAGATTYAALTCLGLHVVEGAYLGPTLIMGASAACTLTLALTSSEDEPASARLPMGVARDDARLPVWARTLAQIVVFWGVFLLALPAFLRWCELLLGFPRMPTSPVIGALVIACGSAIGVWSARTMVRVGRGTPLPTDAAPELVIAGPYRFVRNPMAVGGIAQGVGVSILIGSWWMLGASLIGAALWHACVRPIEEDDLRARFGEAYIAYTRRVRCWVPLVKGNAP